nr:hypothetical protein [Tanacetum cinerariifolium]
SDEVIKSSVKDLVPIPSESEGIPGTMYDVHLVNNPTPLEAKDHCKIVINSNDDISSSDDDSLYNENIKYVEASPYDSELVSLEATEIVIPEEEEIKDDNLCEKLLNVHLLITNIEALKDNLTPSSKSLTNIPGNLKTLTKGFYPPSLNFLSFNWESRNIEDKILVPKPPKNCAKCGHPVNGPYCQGCALLRERLEEDLVSYFQNFQNISQSSNDSINVVNAPREPFVVKQDHGEEIVQQYVLYSVWSLGSTNPQNTDGDAAFDEKEPDFEGSKPENLSIEFEDFSVNIINEDNAAGTLVHAIGQLSPNSTNPFSAAGPLNAAASPTRRKSSCIDTSQLLDDPNMPELED